MFQKVLIANRGEIAIRVARTLKEMGIVSVAVYSEIDRDAPHVREADEAFLIGPAVPAESYLNIEKIIATAKEAGAEAIHPGYGFLAENADFARACAEAGIVWIGPPAEAIEEMGSKTRAREIMEAAGVPIVPGSTEVAKDVDAARKQAEEAGYPVACKAAGGGGGKGFRVAMTPDELEEAFDGAAREGEKFFSDDRVYVERYLEDPRHVEVQVLADSHGNVIHLGERDCSIQRRHQKVIEEAPGPAGRRRDARADRQDRHRCGRRRRLPRRRHDRGYAGRRRVLLPRDEHPGPGRALRDRDGQRRRHRPRADPRRRRRAALDLPRGRRAARLVDRVPDQRRGRAQEIRPAPGPIGDSYREPSGPGVRVDSGVEGGSEVTPMYDPMVAKLIVWDVDREKATRRMLRALCEYDSGGLTTLIPFHEAILATEQWAKGETCRDLMEDREWLKSTAPADAAPPEPSEDGAEMVTRDYKVEVSGKLFDVKVIGEAGAGGGGAAAGGRKPPKRERKAGGGASASSE